MKLFIAKFLRVLWIIASGVASVTFVMAIATSTKLGIAALGAALPILLGSMVLAFVLPLIYVVLYEEYIFYRPNKRMIERASKNKKNR